MSNDDEEKWRRRGEEMGRILHQLEAMTKRVARLENGVLAILTAAAALYLKTLGVW